MRSDRMQRQIERLLDQAEEATDRGVWLALSDEEGRGAPAADRLKAQGSAHLDFALEEFRTMKMQPYLGRALRHKGLLNA